jgi:hypothetical protein
MSPHYDNLICSKLLAFKAMAAAETPDLFMQVNGRTLASEITVGSLAKTAEANYWFLSRSRQ